jgi:hypothetical protein
MGGCSWKKWPLSTEAIDVGSLERPASMDSTGTAQRQCPCCQHVAVQSFSVLAFLRKLFAHSCLANRMADLRALLVLHLASSVWVPQMTCTASWQLSFHQHVHQMGFTCLGRKVSFKTASIRSESLSASVSIESLSIERGGRRRLVLNWSNQSAQAPSWMVYGSLGLSWVVVVAEARWWVTQMPT